MSEPQRVARGWRAQLAPGRVFQLKRKTYRGNPVCVLITAVPDRWTSDPMCIQVDEYGCVRKDLRNRARFYEGNLRPGNFTGKLVACRRPELERFDAKDIELIRYGCPMDFHGRLDKYEWPGTLPSIPGIEWTVFWMWHESIFSTFLPDEVAALFHGAWHFTASCDDIYPRRVKAWATAETDQRKLNEIHRALGQLLPIHRGTIRVVARDLGDHYLIAPDGEAGPAISTRWCSTISKKTGDGGWSCWS